MKNINKKKTVIFWGTYDLGKPRVRLLLGGAQSANIQVIRCHVNIWKGIEDKSQIDIKKWTLNIIKFLISYIYLIIRYVTITKHDAVVIGYMGQLDVLLVWPFAKIRRIPVVWDAFISLYDTVVLDRKLISKYNPLAVFLYLWEWLACRAADKIFMDTNAQARFIEKMFHLTHHSINSVPVGAETEIFKPVTNKKSSSDINRVLSILFYGQFIPLHGIPVIIQAAQLVEKAGVPCKWIIAGKGQVQKHVDRLIEDMDIKSIDRVDWISYKDLPQWIEKVDVCLGIFGTSSKALRVIPNKIYQAIAVGCPVITGDTPAIKELKNYNECCHLVKPGNARDLADTIIKYKDDYLKGNKWSDGQYALGAFEVGVKLRSIIDSVI